MRFHLGHVAMIVRFHRRQNGFARTYGRAHWNPRAVDTCSDVTFDLPAWQGPIPYLGVSRKDSDRGAPGYGLASPASQECEP